MRIPAVLALLALLALSSLAARADGTVPYDDGLYKGTSTTKTSTYDSGGNTVKETVVTVRAAYNGCDGAASTHVSSTTTRVVTDRATGLKVSESTTTDTVNTGGGFSKTEHTEDVKTYDATGGWTRNQTSTTTVHKPSEGTSILGKDTTTEHYDASGKQLDGDSQRTVDGINVHEIYDPATGHYKAEGSDQPSAPKPDVPKVKACTQPFPFALRVGTVLPTEDTLQNNSIHAGATFLIPQQTFHPFQDGVALDFSTFGSPALTVQREVVGFEHTFFDGSGQVVTFAGASAGFGRTRVIFPSLAAQSTSALAGSVFAGFAGHNGLGLQVEYDLAPQVGSIKGNGIGLSFVFRPFPVRVGDQP